MSAFCQSPFGLAGFWFGTLQDPFCSSLLSSVQDVSDLAKSGYPALFATTLLLETPVFLFLCRNGQSNLQRLRICWVCNCLSHPAAVFAVSKVLFAQRVSFGTTILLLESFVILLETLLIRMFSKCSGPQAFSTAVAANAFSWTFGGFFV